MTLRPFWSYYGSKYRLAGAYPAPRHGLIVEPFAGAAAYALRYPSRRVLLCDSNAVIAGVWDFLIRAPEAEVLGLRVDIECIDDLGPVPQEARWLVGFWLGRCRATPAHTAGSWMKVHQRQRPGAFWSAVTRQRIASQQAAIRHWQVRWGSYGSLHVAEPATWFVDPPYRCKAGRRYPHGMTRLDYSALATWCRGREGQVIVCEQDGADWLPFVPMRRVTGARGRRLEVVWSHGEGPPLGGGREDAQMALFPAALRAQAVLHAA